MVSGFLPNESNEVISLNYGNTTITVAGKANANGSGSLVVRDLVQEDIEQVIDEWRKTVYDKETDAIGFAADYKINEDGSASGYYGQALLSNRAGDFVFEADKNTTMTFAGANSINASQQSAVLEEDVSTSTLTLRDMDYWSTQGITGTTQIQDMSSFKSDLKLENNKITGTVENTFATVFG